MMKTYLTDDSGYGRLLWMTNGSVEAAAALDYGLRIMVLRCVGMENLLYRQPDDLSDGLATAQGWRLYGGHRFWTSPESDASYYPDSEPITYELDGESVLLTQKTDPWTGFQKQLRLSFCEDGTLKAEHILTNCNAHPVRAAAWGVTTLQGGGVATLPWREDADEYTPDRALFLWPGTCPTDSRLSFEQDAVIARHLPAERKLKIGVYSPQGSISMENAGQRLTISFELHPMQNCPDHGSNVELYLDKYIMELETLGEATDLAPAASVTHTEYWHVAPQP